MKIHLKRVNEKILFEATNERGISILIDGSKRFGGEDKAPSPTELLMMSQAACTAMDVVVLLKKMNQSLSHIEIDLDAQRASDQVPSLFTNIHLHYKLYGNISEVKAEKAISLSIEKYCTVTKMIDKVAKVTYDFSVFPATTNNADMNS